VRRGGGGEILVLSHPHADHDGGAPWLTLRREPARVLRPSLERGNAGLEAACGSVGARLESLGEGGEASGPGWWCVRPVVPGDESTNDASLAVRAWLRDAAVLVPGDLEVAGEAALVRTGADLRAQVLVLPHHGSDTSSSDEFLDAVRPVVAIASVGAGNRYGHPAPETLRRLRDRGIRVLRTDRDGGVLLGTDGDRWWCRTATGRRWGGSVARLRNVGGVHPSGGMDPGPLRPLGSGAPPR
jgi:competence protein ComEC